MIGRLAVWASENVLCFVAHRTAWIPLWNQSTFLTCPTLWLINHSRRFARLHDEMLQRRVRRYG